MMYPQVTEKALLIPRVNYWPDHGWRAEVAHYPKDRDRSGVVLGEFFATQAEAHADAMKTVESWLSP